MRRREKMERIGYNNCKISPRAFPFRHIPSKFAPCPVIPKRLSPLGSRLRKAECTPMYRTRRKSCALFESALKASRHWETSWIDIYRACTFARAGDII